jgi:hypothetical protein
MSESTFPFDHPGSDEADPGVASDGRKRLVVLGGVGAAVLAGALGWTVLGGGEPAQEITASAAPAPGRQVQAQPPVVDIVPAAATDVVGRNPFKARYLAPAAASAPVGGAVTSSGPTGSGATSVGGSGVVLRPLAPPPGPTGTDGPGAPAAPASSQVSLVRGEEVDGALVAVLTVDGQTVRVKVGETFGNRKQVLLTALHEGPGAGQWTAVLRVGDAPPKDLISGETIHVTA